MINLVPEEPWGLNPATDSSRIMPEKRERKPPNIVNHTEHRPMHDLLRSPTATEIPRRINENALKSFLFWKINVAKVSGIFKFFLRRFTLMSVLGLRKVGPGSELNSTSIDVKIIGSHRAKIFSHAPPRVSRDAHTITWVKYFLLDNPLWFCNRWMQKLVLSRAQPF